MAIDTSANDSLIKSSRKSSKSKHKANNVALEEVNGNTEDVDEELADTKRKEKKEKHKRKRHADDGVEVKDVKDEVKRKKEKKKLKDDEDSPDRKAAEEESAATEEGEVGDARRDRKKEKKKKHKAAEESIAVKEHDGKVEKKKKKRSNEDLDADEGHKKEKKSKKRKHDTTQVESDEKEERREKKHKKRSKGSIDPTEDESLSDQARKALGYVHSQTEDPSNWKFNKARQNWLIRNMWSSEAIPEKYIDLVHGYLRNAQGGVRETLIKTCREIIDPPPSETPPKTATEGAVEASSKPADAPSTGTTAVSTPVDETKIQRARALLTILMEVS